MKFKKKTTTAMLSPKRAHGMISMQNVGKLEDTDATKRPPPLEKAQNQMVRTSQKSFNKHLPIKTKAKRSEVQEHALPTTHSVSHTCYPG